MEEPDKADWTHAGLKCAILRIPHSGHLCGYVGVGKDHPWFGKDYSDRVQVKDLANRKLDMDGIGPITVFTASVLCDLPTNMAAIVLLVNTHRGLAYSSATLKDHSDPDTWWFGFDCAHYGDATPQHPEFGGTYRDFTYVTQKVNELADQLANTDKITGGQDE